MTTIDRSATETRERGWLAALFSTRRSDHHVDMALVAVRAVLAWIFIYYGATKLFGWFNGPGLDATANFFADTAHLHPGHFFAVFGGLLEFVGGIAMALGLLSRLAGIALLGDMIVAMITVTWTNGINSEQVPPGYELNLALAALALVVAVMGAGRYSVDALVEHRVAGTSG